MGVREGGVDGWVCSGIAIEVYFKEAKQHLGCLKEQSTHYAAYLASIPLAPLRCCLLILAQADAPHLRVAGVRQRLSNRATHLDFGARRLWGFFRTMILRALEGWAARSPALISEVMD